MSYYSMAELLEELSQSDELVRVDAVVDPVLEIAEITDRIACANGPAILFGAVSGHEIPVLTNLLGTEKRIRRVLDVDSLDVLADRIEQLVIPSEPEGWFEKIKSGPTRASLRKLPPKTVRTGTCQQVVKLGADVDLTELPAIHAAIDQSHPVITAACVFAADATSGRLSIGRHDLTILDADRVAVCWHPHDGAAFLMPSYRERQDRMPLAVVLGGDPVGLLASMAPVPLGADTLALAGLLREKPREMVKCRTVPLVVPTDAELVLEGYVDPFEPTIESGPLATPGGNVHHSHPVHGMHVTAITHRANPVFPAIVPSSLCDEACVIGRALATVFRSLVRAAIADLVDFELPAFGAARQWLFVSIRKHYAGQARQTALALWGLRQLMFSKLMIVVDEEIDVHDHESVWAAVAVHTDLGRDVIFQQGPADPWDPSGLPHSLQHKMALDATRKLPAERDGLCTDRQRMPDKIRQSVEDRWTELGISSLASS